MTPSWRLAAVTPGYTAVVCHAPAACCDRSAAVFINNSGAERPQYHQSPPTVGADELHNYESCTFDDGLQIAKIDSLPRGLQQRTINTTQRPKVIQMLAGRRIMFAYGVGGDFFLPT